MSLAPRLSPLLVSLLLAAPACKPPKPLPNDPDAKVPEATAPTWKNWSGNLVHRPAKDGEAYYFSPVDRSELLAIVNNRPAGVSLRVSGQRHSQPPLVADDNRDAVPETAKTWLVDLSCYADLGDSGQQSIVLSESKDTVTVNAGVREDALDAFLTNHDLMLETVTAGGFFSLGGMTVVDVHGATVDAPIFAETTTAFTIMGADGTVTTIDASTPKVDGWSPLQFARVSLGALGIVTSVTVKVKPRPYATSLRAGHERHTLADEAAFVERYAELLQHDRLESFWNPYSHEFLALYWDEVSSPTDPVPNSAPEVASACTIAENDAFGAPFERPVEERVAEKTEQYVQLHGNREEAKLLIDFALEDIEKQVDAAAAAHAELWLAAATQVVFMSYFVELPSADAAGLSRAWKGLQAVHARLEAKDFLIAGPLEFRFIRGGDSALAGTYTTTPDALFINFDLIAFVPPEAPRDYPQPMLQFFADVEREWVAMGGWPHNGKMYGFHDPAGAAGNATTPFDPGFLGALAERRGERLEAFARYRESVDAEGVFCNDYLVALGICG